MTAKSQIQDVLEGFNSGADDYIRKPFSVEELLVRMKTVLGRYPGKPAKIVVPEILQIGKYRFDVRTQVLTGMKTAHKLTYRESSLLQALWVCRDGVMERKEILIKIWGDDTIFNARSMDVFITKLRKYLKQDPEIEIINIRGVGYKLVC